MIVPMIVSMTASIAPTASPARRVRAASLAALVVVAGCTRPRNPPADEATAAADRLTLPGAEPFDAALASRLAAATAGKGPGYVPRTRHKRADSTPRYTNRLVLESSPYLLQHAHNPVSWYPWGEEAFAVARRLGRPVLLSVGYSTCHWCHVMEEESFEDEEIAAYLNAHYVAIKVDREERPDVDAIYMSAVEAVAGSGGWPMTVWLTPEREPFFGGTYFPPRDGVRGAPMGFLTLLVRIRQAYDEQPDDVAEAAEQLASYVRRDLLVAPGEGFPGAAALHGAVAVLAERFDEVHGGLAGAPKFPGSLPVRFLLRYHRRTGDARALHMAELTLLRMAAGGMYDHVGGGFHRYATDAAWLVPHFEKMLYDNALLVMAYLEAYQVTGNEDFARVAREILAYVAREMTAPEGGFYSATDADSETPAGHREEGWFFTWTPAEIDGAVGPDLGEIVRATYGVTDAGNFEGRTILSTPRPLAQVAAERGLAQDELGRQMERAKRDLLRARAARPAPLLDDKILAAWNGLMISAHARAALVLGEDVYAARAGRAAAFVLERMRVDGRLRRSYRGGAAPLPAYLDDYAFLIAGLLDLYEATGALVWLDEAIALERATRAHYADEKDGGYFATSHDHEALLAREKPDQDGALPSGNAVMTLNLLRLHELTQVGAYQERADRLLAWASDKLEAAPTGAAELLLALDYRLDLPREVVIVTPGARATAAPLLAVLARSFLPNRVVVVAVEGEHAAAVAHRVPLLEDKRARGGKPTAYVCERGACELPTSDPQVLAKQLRKTRPLLD
jgi:uncharacterized protein YyaL (SSP411 family)